MPEKSGHRLAAILTVPIKQTNTSPCSSLPVSQRRVIGCHVWSRNFVYQKQIIFGKAVHTCMSFNNVKLVHTFGSFIYFAFPASADNMSDMRSGGWGGRGGGGGILPLIQEANRDMPLDGVAFSRLE